jgi:hypothetical protein
MHKKILCICRNGYTRSVATKMCLNKRGYKDVIAIGGGCIHPITMSMLCNWADIILLAQPYHDEFVTFGNESKIDRRFTIGEDIWFNPYNKNLHKIVNKQLDLIKL